MQGFAMVLVATLPISEAITSMHRYQMCNVQATAAQLPFTPNFGNATIHAPCNHLQQCVDFAVFPAPASLHVLFICSA